MALSHRLRVDPIACDGHGLCAELIPERVTLDDWGYPIVDPTPIGRGLHAHARRAVSACPLLALTLETADSPRRQRREPDLRRRAAPAAHRRRA